MSSPDHQTISGVSELPANGRDSADKPPVHVIANDAEAIAVATGWAEKFRKDAARRDRERLLPLREIEQLTQAGLFAITVPGRFGGAEVSSATVAEVLRILSAADPSIGQIPQNHFGWLALFENGTPEQQQAFFGRILAGERIGNAHSEDTLRRQGDYEHELRRVAGGWTVTGRKYYSTGALFAGLIPFNGADEQGEELMFFAESTAPGLTVVDDWDGMGQRTTASGTTLFDNVFVPDFNVFPFRNPETGHFPFGPLANLLHAAIDIGIAEEALADAAAYIRTSNRPWKDNPQSHAEEPFVVQSFGELGLLVRTARLAYDLARQLVERDRTHPSDENRLAARLATADARVLATRAATTVADQFFPLTGARATLGKYALDRHWRNARTHSLHDPIRWKLYYLGNYYLNGIVPKKGSYF